jgi:hypothetical protein
MEDVEMSIIEVDPMTFRCRCCLAADEVMENIFESVYDNIELHEILSILAPVIIMADDGEFCFCIVSYSRFNLIGSVMKYPCLAHASCPIKRL